MANESKFGDFVWCAKTAQGLENFQVFQGVGAEHCTGELVAGGLASRPGPWPTCKEQVSVPPTGSPTGPPYWFPYWFPYKLTGKVPREGKFRF